MSKLWEIFRYELIRNGRRKGYLAATFGIPLLMAIGMFGFHLYQSTRTEEVSNPIGNFAFEDIDKAGYVDASGVFAELPESFEDDLIAYPDEASALAALQAEAIDVYFFIPQDYLETGQFVLHMPSLQINLMEQGGRLAENLIYSTLASGIDEDYLNRLIHPAEFTQYTVSLNAETGTSEVADETNEMIAGGQFAIVYIFSILFFVALMATNNYLMQTVIEERENRLIEILLSTVSPTDLLGGKILAMACLGLFQMFIWIAGGALLFYFAGNMETYAVILRSLNIQVRPEWIGLMLVYFMLMYMIFASIFGTLGAISGSAQEGSQYAGLVVLPTILPYYFFSLIQAEPNGALAIGFSLFPLTSPITTFSRMVVTDVPIWQIIGSIMIVALTAVVALWMAGRIFRVQTLLTGQKLKIKDIPALLSSDNAKRKLKEA
jgi:ABC-2 type transport system permease protein